MVEGIQSHYQRLKQSAERRTRIVKQLLYRVFYSFPVQLLLVHLQKNTMLLGVWVFIILMASGSLGRSFGVMYLFLNPEYLDEVSFWSFLFVGFAFGGFLMVWNITTYILNSFRFPFLASIKYPFLTYCINNYILPLAFLVAYFGLLIPFQVRNEFAADYSIVYYLVGFAVGFFIVLVLISFYFASTNKSIFKFLKKRPAPAPGRPPRSSSRRSGYKLSRSTSWRVDYYINNRLKVRRTRDVRHYAAEMLLKVFRQHHYNAIIFQAATVISIFLFALLMDVDYVRIPAGASILLICTLLISSIGVIKYWLRSWRVIVVLSLMIIANILTSRVSLHDSKAYGLDYNTSPTDYSYDNFNAIASHENYTKDVASTLQILNNWKRKLAEQGIQRPRMVIVSVSGGGQRATAWTTRVLQRLDSLTNGRFLDHTVLMTGASGGMLGAAYIRDVYWEARLHQNNPSPKYLPIVDSIHFERMAKDLLNSIAFSIAVNDLFVPSIPFHAEGHQYIKDRGYAFERQLRDNAAGLLQKRLIDYQIAEREAVIPLMFVTPTVVNDARRLVISPQPVAYMMKPQVGFGDSTFEVDGIDYGRYFAQHDPYNLRLTSALRMSATYPYILPNVTLPTQPKVEVMDAGWRDNYGFDTAIRFADVFKHWIAQHTSGVVLVQIRGFEKENELEVHQQGIINRLLNPLGAVGQMAEVQDYDHDEDLGHLIEHLGKDKVAVIRFEYRPIKLSERASMSWHLTASERVDIRAAVYSNKNIHASRRFFELLE